MALLLIGIHGIPRITIIITRSVVVAILDPGLTVREYIQTSFLRPQCSRGPLIVVVQT